jgi:hypothetical protein
MNNMLGVCVSALAMACCDFAGGWNVPAEFFVLGFELGGEPGWQLTEAQLS